MTTLNVFDSNFLEREMQNHLTSAKIEMSIAQDRRTMADAQARHCSNAMDRDDMHQARKHIDRCQQFNSEAKAADERAAQQPALRTVVACKLAINSLLNSGMTVDAAQELMISAGADRAASIEAARCAQSEIDLILALDKRQNS